MIHFQAQAPTMMAPIPSYNAVTSTAAATTALITASADVNAVVACDKNHYH